MKISIAYLVIGMALAGLACGQERSSKSPEDTSFRVRIPVRTTDGKQAILSIYEEFELQRTLIFALFPDHQIIYRAQDDTSTTSDLFSRSLRPHDVNDLISRIPAAIGESNIGKSKTFSGPDGVDDVLTYRDSEGRITELRSWNEQTNESDLMNIRLSVNNIIELVRPIMSEKGEQVPESVIQFEELVINE